MTNVIDENNEKVSEKVLIKESLECLAEACSLLFETDSNEGHALAFMVDNCIKYGQVIYRDHDILDAAYDYAEYENKYYKEMKDKKIKEKNE